MEKTFKTSLNNRRPLIWIKLLRGVGTVMGLILVGIGIYIAVLGIVDPPSQNLDMYIIMLLSVFLPGVLLSAPWSRIQSRFLWYIMLIGFVLFIPIGALFIYSLNTWAAIHGAGEPENALILLLSIVWISQLPAIWFLRPGWGFAER